jgi:glycosyltransferase involved in cell wall biosynthesis
MEQPTLQILLPTYNGATYLPELLESLRGQTFSTFSLLTYDDGSTDNSIDIVDSYSDHLSIRRISNPDRINRGAAESFIHLIDHSDAECIMFCDQDDIWRNEKVEQFIKRYLVSKQRYGNIPLLLFSDLAMFRGENEVVHPSFHAFNGNNPLAAADPYYLILKNTAPGCSMLCNRKLIEVSLPMEPCDYIHDWWLIISASLRGHIEYINEPLINYRLHESNTVGVIVDKPLPVLISLFSFLHPAKFRSVFARHSKHIKNGRIIFSRHGRRFSASLFWIKMVVGRYIFPSLSRIVKRWKKYSWRMVDD